MEKIKGTFFENTTIIIDTTECKVNTSLAGFYSGYKKEHTIKYEVGIGSVIKSLFGHQYLVYQDQMLTKILINSIN